MLLRQVKRKQIRRRIDRLNSFITGGWVAVIGSKLVTMESQLAMARYQNQGLKALLSRSKANTKQHLNNWRQRKA